MSSPSVRSGVAVSPSEDASASQVLEQPLVRRRRRVVELVDDHDVERVRIEPLEVHLCQRLDGREHVPPLVGPSPST